MTVAEIAAALGGARRSGAWWRCRCPVHHSLGSALAVSDGGCGLVIKCFAGCAPADVLAELRRRGLIDGNAVGVDAGPDPAEVKRRREAETCDRQRRIANALDFWRHETTAPCGAVERYWCARGLALPVPPTIRASASWLRHPSGGRRPTMIALVEHVVHGPVAIHRTWLQPDGAAKASFAEPRLSLGPVGGGAVRLAPADKLLMVSEGIETGMSAQQSCMLPCWAALSTSGLVALALPLIVRTVVILADNDANGAGERAAYVAADRWLAEGRRVRIAIPAEPGTDFNDVLLGRSYARIAEVRDVAAA